MLAKTINGLEGMFIFLHIVLFNLKYIIELCYICIFLDYPASETILRTYRITVQVSRQISILSVKPKLKNQAGSL